MEENKNIQSLVRAGETISGSFRKLRFVTIACIVGMVVCAIGCTVYGIYSIKSMGDKIYVLDKGQALTATRQDVGVTRRDEIQEQSVRLLKLFFNVTPVREIVQKNLDEAISLTADRSLYNYYNDLQESGFYRRVSQANAVQEIVVDSVKVDMQRYPYKVAAYSSLYITRATVVTRSELVTRFDMIDVPRNAGNLNGLKVENFEVVRNQEVDRRNR